MRRPLPFVFVALSIVPLLLGAQSGQTIDRLAPGSRVRITAPGKPARPATLIVRRPDTLLVRWDDSIGSEPVPLADISRLDVSLGQHRSVRRNAGIGALIGVVGGAILGAATYSPCTDTGLLACYMEPDSRGQAAVYGGAAGGALGVVVGALTGLPKRERWEPVTTSAARAAMSIAPSERGVAVRVALRF